jgi:hypothetical protein
MLCSDIPVVLITFSYVRSRTYHEHNIFLKSEQMLRCKIYYFQTKYLFDILNHYSARICSVMRCIHVSTLLNSLLQQKSHCPTALLFLYREVIIPLLPPSVFIPGSLSGHLIKTLSTSHVTQSVD